jgi:hypothetical protein
MDLGQIPGFPRAALWWICMKVFGLKNRPGAAFLMLKLLELF